MKKFFFFATLALGGTLGVFGQESTQIVSTSTLDGARFDMIQSPLDKAVTFRLDKYTGKVDRLGTCPKDDGLGSNRCWKEMTVFDLPKPGMSQTRFQIIIDGPQKLTMLMQIDNGRTWQWGLDKEERWYPFVDCTDKSNSNCLWRP